MYVTSAIWPSPAEPPASGWQETSWPESSRRHRHRLLCDAGANYTVFLFWSSELSYNPASSFSVVNTSPPRVRRRWSSPSVAPPPGVFCWGMCSYPSWASTSWDTFTWLWTSPVVSWSTPARSMQASSEASLWWYLRPCGGYPDPFPAIVGLLPGCAGSQWKAAANNTWCGASPSYWKQAGHC